MSETTRIYVNGSVHRLSQALSDLTVVGRQSASLNDVYIVFTDFGYDDIGADLATVVNRGPIYYFEGIGSFIQSDHPTLVEYVYEWYEGATVEEVRDNPDEYEWGDQFYYHPNVIRIFGSWAE